MKIKAKDLEMLFLMRFLKETGKMHENEIQSLREIINSEVMNAEME